MRDAYKVVIHAAFETRISGDDKATAQAICERLFQDEIISKAEMFSVRVERVEVEPHQTKDGV